MTQNRFNHVAGTICYKAMGHDYGLSRDDTIYTGIDHISVTLDPNGDYPFFTIPLRHLQKIYETKTVND